VNFRPFDDRQLPQLMSWFVDAADCRTWGGPDFRFPFTESSFREDSRIERQPSWALVDSDLALAAFGQFYLRIGRCHLAHLAVAPSMRSRGLGTRLIEELCRTGGGELGVDSFSLLVLSSNEAALRLYRRLGFGPAQYPGPSHPLEDMVYMVASKLP
jgi:ribosomal protein S18 acetylase RimI-like enzyme